MCQFFGPYFIVFFENVDDQITAGRPRNYVENAA